MLGALDAGDARRDIYSRSRRANSTAHSTVSTYAAGHARRVSQRRGIASPRNPRAGVDGSLGADLLAGGACEKRQPLKGGRMTVKTAPRRFPSNKSWT